jgi:hypothetical protein
MRSKLHIPDGEDFSDVPVPKTVSDNEVGYLIWSFKRKGKEAPFELSGLYRSGMMDFLCANGFHRLAADSTVIVREQAGILGEVGMEELKGFILNFIDGIHEDGLSFPIGRRNVRARKEALKETYLKQYHLIINESALAHLYPLSKEILRDDAKTAYFPYTNAIVKVSKEGMELLRYEDLGNKCVWKKHVIKREILLIHTTDEIECKFADFIGNVTGGDVERIRAFRTTIGYLLHIYTNPSEARGVILYDEQIGDGSTPNGGSGKGILAHAVGQIRVVTRIDGKGYRSDNQFKFQQVTPDTQIIWLDDPRADFQFSDLFSVISEGLTVEKKNQAAFTIESSQSPKLLIASNRILSTKGTSHIRRQNVLELADFYSKKVAEGDLKPIETTHGGRFFDKVDWDKDEWARFDLYMLQCARDYMIHGLITFEPANVAVNALIQDTSADLVTWADGQPICCNTPYDTALLFNDFKGLYYGDDHSFKQKNFTLWMQRWAESKGWKCEVKRSNKRAKIIFPVSKSV